MTSTLRRYRTSLIAISLIFAVGVCPMLIAPIGRVYILVCERYLNGAPFGHHYPPLVVAFLVPIIAPLVVGFVATLVRQAWRQHRLAAAAALRRDDAGEGFEQLVHDVGLTGRVEVIDDRAAFAFCGGLIRPRIYLSRGLVDLLSLGELEAVLQHERNHMRQHDPLRLFAAELLNRLTPMFPALATLTERIRVNTELAADRAALRYASIEQLTGALVKVMRAGSSMTPLVPDATVAALSPTDARVATLLGQPVAMPFDRRDLVISFGVMFVAAAVLTWLALQPLPLLTACRACSPF